MEASTVSTQSSGEGPKPSSRSPFTGSPVSLKIRAALSIETSRLSAARPSGTPMAKAMPSEVEASAEKPSRASSTAEPPSQGLGMTKQPLACRSRKRA